MEALPKCGVSVRAKLLRCEQGTEFTFNGILVPSTLRDGDESITEETLLQTKYNKHVVGGWRYSIE
jgi:glutaredoxin-related protein